MAGWAVILAYPWFILYAASLQEGVNRPGGKKNGEWL